jgi:hypothetical protein
VRIRHSRLTRDFLQVPNATVRDDRLSHMARGILVELLSRPDGWEVTADGMWQASVAKHGKASPGRRVFRAAFAELKEYGYLTAGREPLPGGRHATILMLTDVPQAGTSVRPAETSNIPAQTDVPQGGTSENATDVPAGGTSDSPAETDVPAGRTDVPLSDVPPCGTSKEENGETNTGEKTSSAAAVTPIREITAADKIEFGNFWALYPKSRDMDATREAWVAAVRSGVDPKKITEAAIAYAKEKAGEDLKFIKYSVNWLKQRRYEDKYAPEPDANGRPQLRAVSGGFQPYSDPIDQSVYDEDL